MLLDIFAFLRILGQQKGFGNSFTITLLQVVYRFCEIMIAIRDTRKLHTDCKPLIRFPVISPQWIFFGEDRLTPL